MYKISFHIDIYNIVNLGILYQLSSYKINWVHVTVILCVEIQILDLILKIIGVNILVTSIMLLSYILDKKFPFSPETVLQCNEYKLQKLDKTLQ